MGEVDYDSMLTRRKFISSGVAIGAGHSTEPRASALIISYSHQVWNGSNGSDDAVGAAIGGSSLPAHAQAHCLLNNEYPPTNSFFAMRDSFDKRKTERS
jgi:hypothetical protein